MTRYEVRPATLAAALLGLIFLMGCGVAAPSSSPTASSTPQPPAATPTVTPIGTRDPADATVATRLAGEFETAIANADWPAAWSRLAPEVRATTTFTDFASAASGVYEHVDGVFEASPPRHDAAEIRGWVFPDNYPLSPAVVTTANLDRSFVVHVTYPKAAEWCQVHTLNDIGCGTQPADVLLVGPDLTGHWWVW